ncbi:MAG: 6-phosphogluconolactonase [Chloroflexia bacterium]|nr:6-phosphogluconolactonase [Chloroflexia bacterium]
MMDEMLRIYPSVGDLQDACAEQVAQALKPTTESQTMTIALSGGSTPRHMHELLAQRPHVDWSRVHVFWGDERTVPPDHEESNFRMAKESLLDRASIPEDQIHRMAGEKDPVVAAEEYEKKIQAVFNVRPPEMPRFDVVILGMGADGHTASLFPDTKALLELKRYAVANHVPQQNTVRLTLTFPVLNAAQLVIFMVAGADKAGAVERCLQGTEDVPPAGQVQPTDGQRRWLLDAEAAARLISDD